MKIWVDADACPVVIKDIIYKAAVRTGVEVTLVANQTLRVPSSGNITFLQVPKGLDVADKEISQRIEHGDLVITADIPLAAEIVGKGGFALNPRGELYTAENVRDRLNTRDFMDSLRAAGIETGGPPALSKKDRQAFANHLDQLLSRYVKK
jgi:uncharacterized protein YaiI (UPF0178 family)